MKFKMPAVLLLLNLLLAIVAGCGHDPYTSLYPTTRPNPDDLNGVYVPDTNAMAFIANEGHYSRVSTSITLLSGGTIVMTNIPDWWQQPGEPHGGFDSGRGTWEITKHQDWWWLRVDFTNTEQFSSLNHRPGGFSAELALIGERPPYRIYLDIGDPDNGRGMLFERQSEAAGKAP